MSNCYYDIPSQIFLSETVDPKSYDQTESPGHGRHCMNDGPATLLLTIGRLNHPHFSHQMLSTS